jgi:outer membrane protein assembly factor BamB
LEKKGAALPLSPAAQAMVPALDQAIAASAGQPRPQVVEAAGNAVSTLSPLDFAAILAQANFSATEIARELLRKVPQLPFTSLPFLLMKAGQFCGGGVSSLQLQQALAASVAAAPTLPIQPAPPAVQGATPAWCVPLGGADLPPGMVRYCSSSQAGLPDRLIVWGEDVLVIDPANGQVTFALDQQQVVAVGDGVFYALDPNGMTLSAVDTTGRTLWQASVASGACTVGDQAVFVLDQSNGALTALDKTNGQMLWTKNHLNAQVLAGGLAAGSGKVVYRYVLQPHVCALHALDQQTGELSWQFQPDVSIDSLTLGMQPNLVIEDGVVFVAAVWIYFLDAATGKVINTCPWWRQNSGLVEWSILPSSSAVFIGTDEQSAFICNYRNPSSPRNYYPDLETALNPPTSQAHTRPFFYNGRAAMVYDLNGQGQVERLDLSMMFRGPDALNRSQFCSLALQTAGVAVHGDTMYYCGMQMPPDGDPLTGQEPTPISYLLAIALP